MQSNGSLLKKVVEKTIESVIPSNVITITNTLDLLSIAHISPSNNNRRKFTKAEKYNHSLFFEAFRDIKFFYYQLLHHYLETRDEKRTTLILNRLDGLLDYMEENNDEFQMWLDEMIVDEDLENIRTVVYIMASIHCSDESPATLNKVLQAFNVCKTFEITAFIDGLKLAKHPALNSTIQALPKAHMIENVCNDLVTFRKANIFHELEIIS